ncbi:MAG: hypothetical protein AAGK04_03170 [Planctomycetota bacterium]
MHRSLARAGGALLVAAAIATSASATVVHDEGVDGDLSTDPAVPTPLAFAVGTNTVTGSMSAPSDTRDYFTFTVGAGQSLNGIFLIDYTDLDIGGNGNRGFIHIDDGATSVIPSGATAGDFLGGSHLDRGVFPDAATNVLTTLAAAPQGGVGFVAPLGPGTYTINVQQTGPQNTGYTLDFQFVPSPGALAAIGAGGLLALRRRR